MKGPSHPLVLTPPTHASRLPCVGWMSSWKQTEVTNTWGGTLNVYGNCPPQAMWCGTPKAFATRTMLKQKFGESLVCWNEDRIPLHHVKKTHPRKRQWHYHTNCYYCLHIHFFPLSWKWFHEVLTSDWTRWISLILFLLAMWLWESYFLFLSLSFTSCTLEIIMPTSRFKVRIKSRYMCKVPGTKTPPINKICGFLFLFFVSPIPRCSSHIAWGLTV